MATTGKRYRSGIRSLCNHDQNPGLTRSKQSRNTTGAGKYTIPIENRRKPIIVEIVLPSGRIIREEI